MFSTKTQIRRRFSGVSSAFARFAACLLLFAFAAVASAQSIYSGPPHIRSIEVQKSGKLILMGRFFGYTGLEEQAIIRLHPNGALDPSFQAPALDHNSLAPTLVLPDDKILIFGNLTNGIIRLHADGSVDPSFRLQWVQSNWFETIHSVALEKDGDMLAAGQMEWVGDVPISGFARFDSNGTFDPTFVPTFKLQGSPSRPSDVKVQPDGKILVTGQFDEVNGVPRNAVARLNPDGTLDPSFVGNPNLYWNFAIFDLQPDGKFYVPGQLGAMRLMPDGTIDYRFNPGLGVSGTNRYVHSAKIHQGTNLFLAGRFEFYDGYPRKNIARVTQDGSLDTSFDARLSYAPHLIPWPHFPYTDVYAIKVFADNSFMIAGSFTHVQGLPRTALARFTPDGRVDPSFDAFQPRIDAVSFTEDGFYQLKIAGEKGRPYRVEATQDFKSWQPLRNFIIEFAPFQYIDLREISEHTFYRVVPL